MHDWPVGGLIRVGWPDHDVPEQSYTIVELDLLGKVFRARRSLDLPGLLGYHGAAYRNGPIFYPAGDVT